MSLEQFLISTIFMLCAAGTVVGLGHGAITRRIARWRGRRSPNIHDSNVLVFATLGLLLAIGGLLVALLAIAPVQAE